MLTSNIFLVLCQCVSPINLINSLESSYQSILQDLQKNYLDSSKSVEDTAYRYRAVRDKIKEILDESVININDIQMTGFYKTYLNDAISNQEFFKITRKQEVTKIISEVLQPYGITFDLEEDFIDLLQMVDKSTWFDAWDFLLEL
jgi:hypothetical protein